MLSYYKYNMTLKFFQGYPQKRFFPFLKLSFPDFSFDQYQRINNGKRFVGWVWAENTDGELVACTAIFKKKVINSKGYKMGLFCIHPQFRRCGIGKKFYQYVSSHFNPLEWGAITEESIFFYTSIGAINHGGMSYGEGKMYNFFTSDDSSNSANREKDTENTDNTDN